MIGKLRLLPGATGSNVAARDGYDAEADAAMTLVEFERWLLCQIAIYHHAPHSALGGLCPAQMWEREAAKHSPLLPVSVDAGELFRQFLPSKSLTVRSEEHTSALQSLMRISYAVFCLKQHTHNHDIQYQNTTSKVY